MQNINKEVLCGGFYPIPCEVAFDKIFLNFSVNTIVSYARTSKPHYKELIENFRELCDRTVGFSSIEIAQNPLLPLLTVINGWQKFLLAVTVQELQKLSVASALFEKNKKLFSNDRRFIALRELYKYKSLTLEACKKGLIQWNRCGGVFQNVERQVKDKVYTVDYLRHEIFRSRALIILHFLAGFLDAKPFVFLKTLRWLKDTNGLLINLPIWARLFYWLYSTKGDIYTARNFLINNIDQGLINKTLLEMSFKVGFAFIVLAICLLIYAQV
jgi:hypothetical protein